MTDRFPDLELYILNADPDAVLEWLQQDIGPLEVIKTAEHLVHWRGQHGNGSTMDIHLTLKADKNFASLWFKQNHTPWDNDLNAGRRAFEALGQEVRCSDSGWKEDSENDEGGWVKINHNGEKSFSW